MHAVYKIEIIEKKKLILVPKIPKILKFVPEFRHFPWIICSKRRLHTTRKFFKCYFVKIKNHFCIKMVCWSNVKVWFLTYRNFKIKKHLLCRNHLFWITASTWLCFEILQNFIQTILILISIWLYCYKIFVIWNLNQNELIFSLRGIL